MSSVASFYFLSERGSSSMNSEDWEEMLEV